MSLEQALRIERPDEPLREQVVQAVRQGSRSDRLASARTARPHEVQAGRAGVADESSGVLRHAGNRL